MTERPEYLKPVPDTDGATALAPDPGGAGRHLRTSGRAPRTSAANRRRHRRRHRPGQPASRRSGIAGLTPPLGRAHSGMFTTDVLVELGFVDKERAQLAVEEASGPAALPSRSWSSRR